MYCRYDILPNLNLFQKSAEWPGICPNDGSSNDGYPQTCFNCLQLAARDEKCTLPYWGETKFAKNICSQDTIQEINLKEPARANCTVKCDLCEEHYQCASGCCGSLEDGIKRCRANCYDEFANKLFDDVPAYQDRDYSCLIDAEAVAAVAGAFVGLTLLAFCCQIFGYLLCLTPIIIGLICICKTCCDRDPIDKKIREADQAAKQKVTESEN